jgi:repressor LexA
MLTPRQQEILEFIRTTVADTSSIPTVSQIQKHFGFASPHAVTKHLDALARKGVLKREPGTARNIRLLGAFAPPRMVTIPIFGAIPAGFSTLMDAAAAERSMGVDAVALGLTDRGVYFGLTVRGASMTGVGIHDGDTVLLEHGAEPRDGSVVAALIDTETTLKTFRKLPGKPPYLQAENPDFQDLIPVRSLEIQGVFRALIRVGGRDEHGGLG